MKCIKCSEKSRVLDTYSYVDMLATRRRRVCPAGHRFTTLEFAVKDRTTAKTAAKMLSSSVETAIKQRQFIQEVSNALNNVRSKVGDV